MITPVIEGSKTTLTTALSPTIIEVLSILMDKSVETLLTVNSFGADALALYLSLPVNVATTVKVLLFTGVYS